MTNSYDVDHGLSQCPPGPLEPVEVAKVPAAKQFRKKPVVVQAVQYPCAHPALQRCSCDANSACSSCGREFIMTLEGPLNVSPGDWIITGVQGEHYPCKPDIFAATYEEAAAPVSTVAQAYGAPAEVANRIEQYIAHYGQENSASLLLYEAMKALRAPAAGDALGDPALQKLFGEAISGALGFGAQGLNPPPAGHWLEPFWKMARADAALAAGLALLDHPLLREVLGYVEDAGPADVWGSAQAWMALRDAAIAAQQGKGVDHA